MDTWLLPVLLAFSEAGSGIAKWWWISNLAHPGPMVLWFFWLSPWVGPRPLLCHGECGRRFHLNRRWPNQAWCSATTRVCHARLSFCTCSIVFHHCISLSHHVDCYVQQVFLEHWSTQCFCWMEMWTEHRESERENYTLMTIALSGTDSNVMQLLKQTTMPTCQLFELDMWAPGLCTHHCCALRLFKKMMHDVVVMNCV